MRPLKDFRGCSFYNLIVLLTFKSLNLAENIKKNERAAKIELNLVEEDFGHVSLNRIGQVFCFQLQLINSSSWGQKSWKKSKRQKTDQRREFLKPVQNGFEKSRPKKARFVPLFFFPFYCLPCSFPSLIMTQCRPKQFTCHRMFYTRSASWTITHTQMANSSSCNGTTLDRSRYEESVTTLTFIECKYQHGISMQKLIDLLFAIKYTWMPIESQLRGAKLNANDREKNEAAFSSPKLRRASEREREREKKKHFYRPHKDKYGLSLSNHNNKSKSMLPRLLPLPLPFRQTLSTCSGKCLTIAHTHTCHIDLGRPFAILCVSSGKYLLKPNR